MSLIQVTRQNAKRTLGNLMRVHEETIREIDEGKQFWKGGENNTDAVRRACMQEILNCRKVYEAFDKMHDGQIKEAAALCEQIQEFIPNAH